MKDEDEEEEEGERTANTVCESLVGGREADARATVTAVKLHQPYTVRIEHQRVEIPKRNN